MAKSKKQKKEILKSLSDKISRSKSIVFVNFNGLGVKENEELRKKLSESNSEYYVAKKTLLAKALKDNKIDNFNIKEQEGQIAVVFGYEDEVAPAKVVDNFQKNNLDKDKEENIGFIGGFLEGRIISQEEVMFLAKLPSRQELYAKIAGSINAPIFGFVNALACNLRNLVGVLNAVKDKKV